MLILSRPNPRHFTWRAGIFIGAYLAVVIAASLAVEALINRMGQHEFANPAASFVMGVGAYWFPPLPWFPERPMTIQRRTILSLSFGLVMALTVWATAQWRH